MVALSNQLDSPSFEGPIWAAVNGEWRRVFGDFNEAGVSIEWHDFTVEKDFEWSQSFHHEALEICLNISGVGHVECRSNSLKVGDGAVAVYTRRDHKTSAFRPAGVRHRFVTIELSKKFLKEQLPVESSALRPFIREFLGLEKRGTAVQWEQPMSVPQKAFIGMFENPPVAEAAKPVWYKGKILELVADLCFSRGEELFCSRQKRVAGERVERVKSLLQSRLAEPPSLDEIGKSVGCSSFYLSRIFSQEVGMTISQYLRKIRIEKAAELLLSGRHNVTEAALEVGYSSLSHFSRAFCETTGHCPALYAAMKRVEQ